MLGSAALRVSIILLSGQPNPGSLNNYRQRAVTNTVACKSGPNQ